MSSVKRLMRFSLVLIYVFLLCAYPAQAAATVRVGLLKELTTLDRNYATVNESLVLSQLTDDGLIYINPWTLNYEPLLAERYFFKSPTELIVTIRQGLQFHSGALLTADDVVYSLRWAASEEGRTHRRHVLQGWFKSATVIAPYKVSIQLNFAYPLVLRDLAISIPIRRQGVYQQDGVVDRGAQSFVLDGLGPYRVETFEPGNRIVLEKNRTYYPASPKRVGNINRFEFKMFSNSASMLLAAEHGDIDWSYRLPLDISDFLSAIKGMKLINGTSMRITFMALGVKGNRHITEPTLDLAARQAINYAINRADLVRYMLGAGSQIIDAACHPRQLGCPSRVTHYSYDVEKARSLLLTSSWDRTQELNVWAYQNRHMAEVIVADLKAIGFKARLRYVSLATLNQARIQGMVQAYIGSWGSGGTADAAAIANTHWFVNSPRNLLNDNALSSRVIMAQSHTDPQRRIMQYRAIFSDIAQQAYWVPLATVPARYLTADWLSFIPSRDGIARLYEMTDTRYPVND